MTSKTFISNKIYIYRHFPSLLILLSVLFVANCAHNPRHPRPPQPQQVNMDPNVERVQQFLQTANLQNVYFHQIWPNGADGNGVMDYHAGYLDMRFSEPHKMEFKAQGNSALYTDEQHHSKTHLGLAHRPLGLLMQTPIQLSDSVDVLNVQHDTDLIRVTLARKKHIPDGTVTLTFHDLGDNLALYDVALTDSHNKLLLIQLSPPK